MPFVENEGLKIYYEVEGKGEPVLFITGWGFATWTWFRQRDFFSSKYLFIAFDNRGAGRSDKPDYPYKMGMLARDALHVLNAAGVGSAHVVGLSMGGLIAQQLAKDYPQAVKSLVLVSTHHGGPNFIWPKLEDLASFLNILIVGDRKEYYLKRMALAFSKEYYERRPADLEWLVEQRCNDALPLHGPVRQYQAILGFNSEPWLKELHQPTLIVAGLEDRVVPPQNAKRLMDLLPNSRLVYFRGAGHLVCIEKWREFNEIVDGFLQEVIAGRVQAKKSIEYIG